VVIGTSLLSVKILQEISFILHRGCMQIQCHLTEFCGEIRELERMWGNDTKCTSQQRGDAEWVYLTLDRAQCGSCECGNEPCSSVNNGEFLDRLRDYQFLKQDSDT
jgi:hypothetical protein